MPSRAALSSRGALGLVNDDIAVVELDSGLDHQCDHRLEGGLGSGGGEGLAVRFEGGGDGLGPGYLEMVDLCHSTTGNRYLGADDVAEGRGAATPARGFVRPRPGGRRARPSRSSGRCTGSPWQPMLVSRWIFS